MDITVLFAFIYLAVDIAYVVFSNKFYDGIVKQVQGKNITPFTGSRTAAAIASYILLVGGWLFFVAPAVKKGRLSVWSAALTGFMYGLVVYGIFNTTLHVMFDGYGLTAVARDWIWGTSWATVVTVLYALAVNPQK